MKMGKIIHIGVFVIIAVIGVARTTEAALKAGLNKAVEKEKEKLMDKASDKLKGLFGN